MHQCASLKRDFFLTFKSLTVNTTYNMRVDLELTAGTSMLTVPLLTKDGFDVVKQNYEISRVIGVLQVIMEDHHIALFKAQPQNRQVLNSLSENFVIKYQQIDRSYRVL